jgi:hypothetical protein
MTENIFAPDTTVQTEPQAEPSAIPFARAPLYVALLGTHPAHNSDRLVLADLAKDDWILFSRELHPIVHDAILDAAQLPCAINWPHSCRGSRM